MCTACTTNITTGYDLDQILRNFGTHPANSCNKMCTSRFLPSVLQNPVKVVLVVMNTNSFCVHHFMPCTKCMYVHQEPPYACAPSSTLCMGIKAQSLQCSKASPSPSMEKECKTCESTSSFCAVKISVHAYIRTNMWWYS